MHDFAKLLERLILTPSRNRKIDYMVDYFVRAQDPSRGYALAALAGELSLKEVKSSTIKNMMLERMDPDLFALSYDYVGDMAETIALLWQDEEEGTLPPLNEIIDHLNSLTKKQAPDYIENLLKRCDANERWALIKLITGGLRIGVSARLAKTALARWGDVELSEIEKIWHGLKPPYKDLFGWLSGSTGKPVIDPNAIFHPLMLSNPIDEDKDFARLDVEDYTAEWKWDGIRVQLAIPDQGRARLFSRTGDEISHSFPDIIDNVAGCAVLDGELLVGFEGDPLPFNDLQQRLNRKRVIKKHLKDYPAFITLYDILFHQGQDLRALPLEDRRAKLVQFLEQNPQSRLFLSEQIQFEDWDDLAEKRRKAGEEGIEGVMIKHKESQYLTGRPKGPWFKWKRDPKLVDAILMYAQRGHGKRSSFYSDYTFGLWKGNEIVPIGKAYFGFTDQELKQIDKWVRAHTVNKFGPVREVEKGLIFEVAFDSVHPSNRHKSGLALRFPRIHRIRWDKPIQEADHLETLAKMIV